MASDGWFPELASLNLAKGSLISESFFTLAEISQKRYQLTPLSIFFFGEYLVLRGVIWHHR